MQRLARFVPIILLIACALIVRFGLYIYLVDHHPQGLYTYDSSGYWQIANNITDHQAFSVSIDQPLLPDHYRTPGYPMFIAFFIWLGGGPQAVFLVQILIAICTVLLVYQMAFKISGSKKVALVSGFVIALDIPSIVFTNLMLTETLFTFFLVLAGYIFVLLDSTKEKNKLAILAGIVIGLAILIRPILLWLPLFMLFFFWYLIRKKKMPAKPLLIVVLVSYITILPWIIRNTIVFNTPFLSSIGNFDLLYLRAAGTFASKEKISFLDAQQIVIANAEASFQGDRDNEPIRYNRHQAREAISIISTAPLAYLRNHLKGIGSLLFKPARSYIDLQLGLKADGASLKSYGNSWRAFTKHTSPLTRILVFFQLLILFVLWFFFVLGIVLLFRKNSTFIAMIFCSIILYFLIVSAGPETDSRFRIPIIPLVAIVSIIGMNHLLAKRLPLSKA